MELTCSESTAADGRQEKKKKKKKHTHTYSRTLQHFQSIRFNPFPPHIDDDCEEEPGRDRRRRRRRNKSERGSFRRADFDRSTLGLSFTFQAEVGGFRLSSRIYLILSISSNLTWLYVQVARRLSAKKGARKPTAIFPISHVVKGVWLETNRPQRRMDSLATSHYTADLLFETCGAANGTRSIPTKGKTIRKRRTLQLYVNHGCRGLLFRPAQVPPPTL